MDSSRDQARLAGAAALISAGAAAVSLLRAGSRNAAPASAPAGDAGLVGLIERVADATNRAGTADDALLACVQQVCRWTGWPVGHVYFVEHDHAVPSPLWYLSDPVRFTRFREQTESRVMARGVGLPGRVLESGRAEWIVDLSSDANFPRRAGAADAGLRGGFSFPIPVLGETHAVLECFSTHTVTPDDRLLEVVSHIGRQLGRLIAGTRAEAALRDSEQRFRSFAETANDAMIAAGDDGCVLTWNPAAERMFGLRESDIVGRPLSMLMPERFRAMHDAGIRRVTERPESSRIIGQTVEVVGLRADGTEFPIELSLSTWETADGRFFGGIIRDIAGRKEAEEQARVLENAPDPIVKVDGDHRILLGNARTEQLFGYERSELVGRPVEDLFAEPSRQRAIDRFRAAIAGDTTPDASRDRLCGRRRDGSEFALELTLRSATVSDGVVVTCILRDVTERRRFESQLRHLADHDHLTALLNRRRFEEELAAREAGTVLLVDLDRFKYVNDLHGHSVGDELVRTISRALTGTVGDQHPIARLGGDEFAILLDGADPAHAERVAVDVLAAVRGAALAVGPVTVSLTASIGVVLFGEGAQRVDAILAAADMAMYAAKDAGGSRFHVYAGDDERVARIQGHLTRADMIRRALDEDRFVLYWQPIIELASGRATHRELLLRMIGDEGEILSPAAFIETAEQFGLIQEIDRWVVRAAIHLLAGSAADDDFRLEVNLSGRSLGDPELPELIEREVSATGIDPGRLVFEITETAAIANMEHAREFAVRLHRLGCRFALDDFGAGFSSFYYLKHLPLDYLKIDGEFVRNLAQSPTDQMLVMSIVQIARGFGMKTIAEFVEDEATLELLRAQGVDYSQGYYHGRPGPVLAPADAAPA